MNQITIIGKCTEYENYKDAELSDGFAAFSRIEVERKDEKIDIIRIYDPTKQLQIGNTYEITGVLRARIIDEQRVPKKVYFIVPTETKPGDGLKNKVEIIGTIKKEPFKKKTFSLWDVTEVVIHSSQSLSYLNCIAFGWIALDLAKEPVGKMIKIKGSLQSRIHKVSGELINEINIRSYVEV